jgi:hypothetical protein
VLLFIAAALLALAGQLEAWAGEHVDQLRQKLAQNVEALASQNFYLVTPTQIGRASRESSARFVVRLCRFPDRKPSG